MEAEGKGGKRSAGNAGNVGRNVFRNLKNQKIGSISDPTLSSTNKGITLFKKIKLKKSELCH